ncbi:universal stress protein [Variovorax sp. J2P1-59]|uniref:universal stress protein n=1 Tax=Variovorax flavidus TaxID=3053501 RepID=UPI002575545D|nr:universal stress protein [Variovorax sp. J2P1-59]MDM0075380.1 universal stress protein [Variovorax sp. J2P1-59]
MFKKILVATDGSELSEKAVESAIGLARQHGAELVAFTVARRQPRSYMDGAMNNAAADDVERQRLEKAQALVDAVGERASASGVPCQALVAHSSQVADSIIVAAEKQHSELIVMASHGRKGVGRLLLGSETQHVLTHSALPVLVLR